MRRRSSCSHGTTLTTLRCWATSPPSLTRSMAWARPRRPRRCPALRRARSLRREATALSVAREGRRVPSMGVGGSPCVRVCVCSNVRLDGIRNSESRMLKVL
eukprot:7389664-Prymnesium_polylepis.1